MIRFVLIFGLLVCFSSFLLAQKKYTQADFFDGKEGTTWNVTSGKAAFGEKISFNTNKTAQHGTGGFGGFKVENNELILKDLNGKSTPSDKKLIYKIKSLDKTTMVLVDDKNASITLTIKPKKNKKK